MHKKLLISSLIFVFVFGLSLSVLAGTTDKPLTNQTAYNIFKTALGDSFGKLDANYKSGFVGSYEYITKEIGTTTIADTRGATDGYDLFATSSIAKLDWFKAQLLANTDNDPLGYDDGNWRTIAGKEQEGIKNAITDRYKNICGADLKKKAPALFINYRNLIKTARTARTNSINTCNTNYKNCDKGLSTAERIIRIEECVNIRENCTNAAYTAYNTALTAPNTGAYDTAFKPALSAYNTCLSYDPPTLGGGARNAWVFNNL